MRAKPRIFCKNFAFTKSHSEKRIDDAGTAQLRVGECFDGTDQSIGKSFGRSEKSVFVKFSVVTFG